MLPLVQVYNGGLNIHEVIYIDHVWWNGGRVEGGTCSKFTFEQSQVEYDLSSVFCFLVTSSMSSTQNFYK